MYLLQERYTEIGQETLELSVSGFSESPYTAIPYKLHIIHKTYVRDSLAMSV